MTTRPLSARKFRKALAQFATGVTVVTVEREQGQVFGMTANSFASVSLHPMLILVCVDQRAKILPMLQKKKRFGISVLKQGQQAISKHFAQGEQNAEADERLSLRYRRMPSGIPVLEDSLLCMSCRVIAAHIAGDHTVFIAEVEDAEIHEGEPLLFFQGEYRALAGNS
jgi:flavin reductase (DIM6/NTAB) family NADH-FMN oxidoreductase RutF